MDAVTPTLKGNPPTDLTSFVGREEELALVRERLHDPACRLLSVIGAGGTGKTRLALEAANRLLQDEVFADGITFVPLAGLSSADFLISAMAEALEISFQRGDDPRAQLIDGLARVERGLLLVLDNFEQLTPGSEILAESLQAAPKLKLLITSRERLNLRDEWLLDLGGLPFPQTDVTPISTSEYGALQLFEQRCRQVRGDFDAEAEYRPIVRICREERRVFQSLSVFRGGFFPEAAEQVAGASLFVLAALADKSMLRRNDSER